jgi:hypothetical protein
MATSTQLGYDSANYYTWKAPGGLSLHLSLRLIRELAAQIAASGDIRGLLLGRSITAPSAATMADDFVVIPPSEDFDSARKATENSGRELCVVGYFRSQRDGQLTLDAGDVETFNRLFSKDGNVGLLIRGHWHGNREAALFYWQDGRPQPREFGSRFSFDALKLASGLPSKRTPDPPEPEQIAPAPPALLSTTEAPVVAPSQGIRWSRLLPTAALFVTGIIAAPVLWNLKGTTSASSDPAAGEAAPATASTYETPLGLKVTSQPHQLEIRWNRAASTVTAAVKGTMSITEAGVTEAIPFDARDLREGFVAYMPKTNDVGVRFEVTAADGSATAESIRVVASP